MDKSIVTLGLFFFLNFTIIQAANSSTSDADYLRNLINQKQFNKLEKLKGEIKSDVLNRWVDYEILLHAIKSKPNTPFVEKRIYEFIKENPGHQFSEKLINNYIKELDKVIRRSDHLKNKVMNLPNASLTDALTSVICFKNIGLEIDPEKFQQLVVENETSIGCQWLIKEWLSKKRMEERFYIDRARYSANNGDLEFSLQILDLLNREFGKKVARASELIVVKIIYQSRRNSRGAYRLFKKNEKKFSSQQKSYLRLQLGTAFFGITQPKAWNLLNRGISSITQHPSETLEIVARMALRKADFNLFYQAYSNFPNETKKKDNWKYWEAVRLYKEGHFSEAKKLFRNLRNRQNFYGYLASTQEKKDKERTRIDHFLPFAEPLLKKNKFSWGENDHLRDILKLFKLQNFSIALPEWKFFIKDFSTHELLNLASYLSDMQIYDRSISAAIFSNTNLGLKFRYPLIYKDIVIKACKENNVPPWLVMGLIRQESRFNKEIRSSAGAIGLMQILPKTALETYNKNKGDLDLTSSTQNINIGTKYLSKLLKQFNNSIPLSLAAYNAGPSRAKKWHADRGKNYTSPAMFIESIPFKETREYVQTVISSSAIYEELFADIMPDRGVKKKNIISNVKEILNTL